MKVTTLDLSTTYCGLRLPHPVMPGASPLVDDMDMVRRLEDAGAAALVMHSLFEEQITRELSGTVRHMVLHGESFAEALSYFPMPEEFAFGPDRYLEQVRRIKSAVDIPVIASLNGVTPEGWTLYARLIQEAGADAIELNVYHVCTSPQELGLEVDLRLFDVVRSVRASVTIPVAVKLSPFYSSIPHVAQQLDILGVDGLVLFNRFYQPDIDPELLETVPRLQLSDSSELLLRLRWLAILSPQVGMSLGVTGGVHTALDAVKAVMAGAHGVQLVAALLQHGPRRLTEIHNGLARWLDEHEYESLSQMRGSMNHARCPDAGALERGNYMRVLQSWGARE
jgi:dihydroorotate dehydrogenase (fumarate)